MKLLGLDGCKRNAWVVAESDPAFQRIEFRIATNLKPLFEEAENRRAVVILDVPIGLCSETRTCDRAARALLKPDRHNSVFRPPCREALTAATFGDALAINRSHCRDQRGISQQAFNIRDRIKSVDDLITPARQQCVREGHPEVTFAILNNHRALEHYKKTPRGIAQRMALLAVAECPGFDALGERIRLGASMIEVDDIIDAAAMLVSARRVASGQATAFPDGDGVKDDRDLLMQIWA